MQANSGNTDQTSRSAAADLGMHCLHVSHKKDTRLTPDKETSPEHVNFMIMLYYKQFGTAHEMLVLIAYICVGHSGSAVECLSRDRGAAGPSLTGVTVLFP